MATNQPRHNRQLTRLLIVAAALLALGIAAGVTVVTTANATATLQTNDFAVNDVNETISGNVTDATVATSLDYNHSVPNAERRVVKLKVGPTESDLTTVDYINQREVPDDATGTVELSGSVLESSLTAEDLDPPAAGNETTTVVVQATIEVTRANGDTVTDTVTEEVTVTLRDDSAQTAAIGGTGTISVTTDG